MTAQASERAGVPFDRVPGSTALFLRYVQDWPRVAAFYDRPYDIASIAAFSRECPRPAGPELERLCATLGARQNRWGAGLRGVDKLRSGAVAVITGQQPGLFTGPLYAALKAISAVKLARALEEMGIPATPVFWIASEDHDHAEIEWAAVLDEEGGPKRVQVLLEGRPDAPVGWTTYGADIRSATAELFESLPASEFAGEVRAAIETIYAPGVSPVDAFARLLARLFSATELTLVDPLDPAMKDLARPALEEAVRRNPAIRAAALDASRALTAAGYHAQVHVTEQFTGLFSYEQGSRRPLKPAALDSAENLSPNALLRPFVQDSIFPTAAYIGGPAEIAYFAQARAVYRVCGRPMPPVVPRVSATFVEPRIARALDAYRLERTDAWRGREFLAERAGRTLEGAPAFDHVRDAVGSELESLRPVLTAVDPTLSGALDTSMRKILYQVESLRTRYVHAESRRSELMDRRLDAIVHAFYPEKKLQEREVGILSFLYRYGFGLIGRMEAKLLLDGREHQFVGIE
ncbi:MAG TPA: bacillithiol biosynthesis BshC [Terriglobia bacterium]|nr:bacillithiol biosynthesis BshC [Terriglobia bacterium]